MTEAGEFGVQQQIAAAVRSVGVELHGLADTHFICSSDAFADWRSKRKTLVMEHFYRHMRKHARHPDGGGNQPAGGSWNFDRQNRKPFGRQGPGMLPRMPSLCAGQDHPQRARRRSAALPRQPGLRWRLSAGR